MISKQEWRKFSDESLHNKMKELVKEELLILDQVLEGLAEVNRRRLHSRRGNPTLFAYLTRKLGYSPATAQLRIDAVRLTQEVPEVRGALMAQLVTLSSVSEFAKFIRREEKLGHSYDVPQKKELFEKIQGLSQPRTSSNLPTLSSSS